MASLEQVLASVPGLAGYQAQINQNNATTLGNLQQGQAVGSILAQIQKQAMDRQAMQRDAQYRQQLAGATTDEERALIAMQAEGPKGVLQHLDRKTQQQATKEATLARLQQQADQFDANYKIRLKQATTAEERAALDASYKQARLALDTAAQRMTGERLFYDTGMRVTTPAMPTLAPAAPQPMMQGQAPNEAAAVAAINAGGGRPMTLEIPAGSPPSAPVAFPNAAPGPVAVQPLAQPNNMDARDLRLQQGVPAAPMAAPAPASVTPMPPEIAALPPKAQAAWRLQQSKPSIAGSGQLTPEALSFTAKQYLAGDRQAAQGYARNATARIALQNAIVDEATKQGMSPQAVAAQMAEYAGTVAGSRTVGQRAANISLAATEAQEMLGIVKETSDKFGRTNFVPWNMALKAYDTNTGSPEIAAFGASVNALVNVYARAINPTGVPTVSDKEHARAVINTVQSPEQVEAVLDIIRRELEIAKKAPVSVREATRRGIVGDSGAGPANAPAQIPEFATEADAAKAGLKPGTKIKIGGRPGTWQ